MLTRRGQKPEVTQEVKERLQVHQKKYLKTREPLLTGITTEYDLRLFREAQARACEKLVSLTLIGSGQDFIYLVVFIEKLKCTDISQNDMILSVRHFM